MHHTPIFPLDTSADDHAWLGLALLLDDIQSPQLPEHLFRAEPTRQVMWDALHLGADTPRPDAVVRVHQWALELHSSYQQPAHGPLRWATLMDIQLVLRLAVVAGKCRPPLGATGFQAQVCRTTAGVEWVRDAPVERIELNVWYLPEQVRSRWSRVLGPARMDTWVWLPTSAGLGPSPW